MTSHASRRAMTVVLAVATVAGVPALAALVSTRTAAPAQISLNTDVPAFTVTGLIPGDSMTRCLRARNEGDAAIGLVEGAAVTGDLASYLRITVERGSGGTRLPDTGPSCSGFAPSGTYAYGTRAGGVAPTSLQPEYVASWAAHAERSLRITIAMPSDTPTAAAAKQGTVTFAFAGAALPADTPGTTTTDPGAGTPGTGNTGIATGTTGGFDIHGHLLTNAQIKKRLRIGKARLLKNGDVVVMMYLPAGGAIRAKVILSGNRYYAHTLLPREFGPKLRVVLHRRQLGRDEVRKYRRAHRRLVARVTTRYRWAHGPHAYVQPEQKLVLVRGRKR